MSCKEKGKCIPVKRKKTVNERKKFKAHISDVIRMFFRKEKKLVSREFGVFQISDVQIWTAKKGGPTIKRRNQF